MNAFDIVLSTSGIASKSLIHITVSSGSWSSNSAADGLMKSWCANKLCQAWSLIILIGNLFLGSAPTKPSNMNNSFPSTNFFIFWDNLSNVSVGNCLFTLPQWTLSCVRSSKTMNLSSGDLPVYFPVLTDNEPVEVTIPSFFPIAISTSFSTDKFL